MPTEDVIIDFIIKGEEQLDSTLEKLLHAGKIDPITAKSFEDLFTKIKSGTTDVKGLVSEFARVSKTATQLGKSVEAAFGAGLKDALDKAGLSTKQFSDLLSKATGPVKTLKAELRELKEALAQAKLNGTATGTVFEAMRQKAADLESAIHKAGKEIKNAGSDTRNIDNVIGSISALAGGFAAAQGAVALFGDEDKNLQKALLRVNGAMALATGLQQFYNATLKEGALTKLADSISTTAQSAALTIYTFITNGATIATKLLRAALISTGIGAIVVLILQLVGALDLFGKETDDGVESIDKFNERLEKQTQNLEDQIKAIDDNIERQKLLNRIRLSGDTLKEADAQTELSGQIGKVAAQQANLNNLLAQRNQLQQEKNAIDEAGKRIGLGIGTAADFKLFEGSDKKLKDLGAKIFKLNKEIIDAGKKLTEESNKGINLTLTQAGDAAQDLFDKQKEAREKAAKEVKELRLRELNDQLAAFERQLLTAKKNSQAEIDIKKKIVAKKAEIELQAEKLGANQILLIKEKSLHDQLELQKEFNKKATTEQLQAQIDSNAAILAGISINNEERLRLQIENINTTAQIEINAAEGNSAKILLIEAKKQADIRALKNKTIEENLAADLQSVSLTNKIIKDGLTKVAADQKQSLDTRIAALKGIENQELLEVDKKIAANKAKQQSDEEYQAAAKKLADERVEIEGNTAAKINEITKQDKEKRIENLKAIASETLAIASQVADFFAQLSSLATEQDRQRIDLQKQQLQALVDAGAITTKQAKIQAQQIEILERQAKQRQAQREKQAAVFKAILAIPQAFLTGLTQGGPILAAIYAAIAAAQAAIIIARPVPKFFRGKKGNYQGPAEVGEMGAELVERNGRMFLYTNPTKTYLHAKDKVYTASETRNILHNTNINTTIPTVKGERFDYEKLAKAIPKSSFSVNIDKDFIEESVSNGLTKTRHFNNRYKF